MKECSKSVARRLSQPNFAKKYFVGNGIDIGGKPDPLSLYTELFPGIKSIRIWDLEDGDAQKMEGAADNSFDFVHSSHCLEHLHDPREGLRNWLRILKPGGYLVVSIPDEDLYEQCIFPSTFNSDHKWTFTTYKTHSWSTRSINILDMVRDLGAEAYLEKIELLNSTYLFNLPRCDRTMNPVSECGIEMIIRKHLPQEIEFGGDLRIAVSMLKALKNAIQSAEAKNDTAPERAT